MKKAILLFILIISTPLIAQYPIGNRLYTFVDSSRSNRSIPCEIYYPAETAGTNTFPALGVYPLITFGHGFVMSVDAYYNFRDTLVPKGYVIILVNTETSFSPVHLDFAKDLAFVNKETKLRAANDPSFFLYQFMNGKSSIMGHSMGGGSTFLSGSILQPGEVDCLAGFAPAETTPSAIQASTQFDLPTLIFSGTADGVTPPAQHHQPLYDSSASSCKWIVDILGGGHCLYANTNIACDFGESLSSPGITISRADQQAITFKFLQPWLAYYLKNYSNGLTELNTGLQNSSTTNYQSACNAIGIEEQGNWLNYLHWEISDHILTIQYQHSLNAGNLDYCIQNMHGQVLSKKHNLLKEGESIQESLESFSPGLYVLKLQIGKKSKHLKFALR